MSVGVSDRCTGFSRFLEPPPEAAYDMLEPQTGPFPILLRCRRFRREGLLSPQ